MIARGAPINGLTLRPATFRSRLHDERDQPIPALTESTPTPPTPTPPTPPPDHGTERRDLRRAIVFGVTMATIEMAILLALLYC